MKTKIIYLTTLIILISSLFFGLGDKILYAKSGIERIIPFTLIFIGIPFCIYKLAIKYTTKKITSNITAITILILGPAFGLWSEYLSENDFKQNGIIVQGDIIKRKWTTVNNRGHWTLTASFKYKSRTYITFSKNEIGREYKVHDKILVRFSKRNPENNEILIE